MDNSNNINKLRSFMSDRLGIDESRIHEATGLQNDLNLYGDDAIDFILKFGKKFKVDVSEFLAADYFRGEGIDLLGGVMQLFKKQNEKPIKILRVSHLLKAIEVGKLNEDVINDKSEN